MKIAPVQFRLFADAVACAAAAIFCQRLRDVAEKSGARKGNGGRGLGFYAEYAGSFSIRLNYFSCQMSYKLYCGNTPMSPFDE